MTKWQLKQIITDKMAVMEKEFSIKLHLLPFPIQLQIN